MAAWIPAFVSAFVAVVTIIVFKVIQLLWSLHYTAKCLKAIPAYLPVHWLYGSLQHMSKPDYFINRAIWGSENGVRISKEWWGPFAASIIVHHPDVWKEVVNAPKSVLIYSTMLGPWLGPGLLVAEGVRWARNRKLLTGAFHFETIKPYVHIYNESSHVLVKKWTKCISSGRPIPIYDGLSRMTLDTLLKCSFSQETNCQIEDIHFLKAIHELSRIFMERYSSFLYRILPNLIYLNCTPHGREYKKHYDYVHAYSEKVIADRRKCLLELETADSVVDSKDLMARALRKGNRKTLDFIDILLMARDEEGHGLSDLEIRYEVDTFMLAGHDTTAHGLAWTLYCLAKHPEHQERCREEINEVFADKDHLEYSDLSKLSYTLWCIKESMRLYPTVFSFTRETRKDTIIDGHMIPKGTNIAIGILNIHRNKEFWPDPEVFDPLRFQPNRISKQHPYAYTPFAAGPRNCIGQNFAMDEMRVAVATILHKFKVSLIDGKPLEVLPLLLYGFKDDVPLKIEFLD